MNNQGMVLKMFSIYDSKAEAYVQPWYEVNRGVALRNFMAAVKDPQTAFHRFPGDYTLFEIGEWDPSKGTVFMYEHRENLGTAIQYLEMSDGAQEALERIK